MRTAVAFSLAFVLVICGVASAEGGPTASTIDAGPAPSVITWATMLEPDRAPRLAVRARPKDAIEAEVTIWCARRAKNRSRTVSFIADAPVRRPIRLPLRDPDECDLSAEVSYHGWVASEGRWGKLTATFVP
jgi:hypothetical protein